MGAISVASDPAGASVYVDGQLAGETPFHSAQLAVGDHRVKVVKDGYLENARIIAVTAGKSSDVSVKLTVDQSGAGSQKPATPAKKKDNKTLLWVAIAGGAGAGAFFALHGGSNKAPTVNTPLASIATQVLGANVVFTESATDPDNDTLSYLWDFGDGTPVVTGNGGVTATHAFGAAGTFLTKVTVDDGKGNKVTSGTVQTKINSITGTWKGTITGSGSPIAFTMTLTQNSNGTSFGTYSDPEGPGQVGGGINPVNASLTLTVTQPPFAPFIFTATLSGDGNTMTGVVNQSGFTNAPFTMTRQ